METDFLECVGTLDPTPSIKFEEMRKSSFKVG